MWISIPITRHTGSHHQDSVRQPLPADSNLFSDKPPRMSSLHSTIRVGLLLILLLDAKSILAQVNSHHPCFEQPHDAKDAIHRLPENFNYWLTEDAVFVISLEERCSFLHLNTDEERKRFIEQFWYRRTINPDSPDEDFKIEHYRRIAFANQKYSSGLVGWKTDRGRTYVILGPPDAVDLITDRVAPGAIPNQDADAQLPNTEEWHYHYIKGIGENIEFQFTYDPRYDDYLFLDSDRMLLSQAVSYPSLFQNPKQNIEVFIGAERPPAIRFKDLEALLVSRVVRHEVKLTHRVEFAAATHATTLAKVDVQIACEACPRESDPVSLPGYPVLLRITKPSGWVVDTLETTAAMTGHDGPNSGFALTAHFDVPLTPGTYQLAIAAKNSATGEAGVILSHLDVPTSELLGMKN